MDTVSATTTALALHQAVQASHLQMALLKRRMESERQVLVTLLQTARQAGTNPPHLGNRIDTYA